MPDSAEKRHVVVSVNPYAGATSRNDEAKDLVAGLRDSGFTAEIITDLTEVTQRANDLNEAGKLRALVGIGGDGTVAELLNRTPPGLPLAAFPRGTENLLGKYIGLHRASVEKLVQTIIDGCTIRLDAGRITASIKAPEQSGTRSRQSRQSASRLFFLMAGFGFDADVVSRVQEARSGHISHLSYLKPIVQSLRNYKYPELDISVLDLAGELQTSIDARWLFVFNCPTYAGGLPIAPQAKCADGMLDYCTFQRGSATSAIKYLTMVLARLHQRGRDVKTGVAARMRVELKDSESTDVVPIQVDGDPFGFAPAEIECCPGRMTILAPREFCSRIQAASDNPTP